MSFITFVLLVVGAVVGFVVPLFWGDLYNVGVDIGFKCAPRTIQCSVKAVLMIVGIVLMALSILCFVVSRHTAGR